MKYLDISGKSIYYIGKKEFLDHIRNKWIITLTIIFLVLTILSSYLAGAQSGGVDVLGGMEDTVASLISISSILIPIIAIILGYAAISGEAENGALSIVLAYPVKRIEVLLGKLFGLGSVLIVSIVLGFGIGGVIIAVTVGASQGFAYLMFIFLTILLGFMYLSLSLCFSTICKKRSTSIGAGVMLFFWSMIFGMIIFGAFMATGGNHEDLITGQVAFPDWIFDSVVFSPTDMNQMSVMLAFDVNQLLGFPVDPPEYMSLGLLVFVQIIWIVIPLFLSYRFFKKRDI